jgi:hypothetical protein
LFWALCLVLVLGFSSRAEAQYAGVSSFAAMHPGFPCDKWLKIEDHAKYPAMAVLWRTFGDDTTCIQKFLKRYEDRPNLLEIHFSNKHCRWEKKNCFTSNKNLAKMSPETETQVALRMFGILATVLQYAGPNTQLVLSVMLEDDLKKDSFLNLVSVLRNFWPSQWMLLRVPSTGDRVSAKQFPGPFEYHSNGGHPTKGCFANEDGTINSYEGTRKFFTRYKPCQAIFAWRSEHQGYRSGSQHNVNPKKRRFNISDEDARELGKILEEHGRN